jgi:hypothetical protein
MNEQSKKAFDFAADLTKQLITLSTSIVTLTLLFSKDLLGPKWLAVLIWTLFLLSTVCGLWTLMALTGTLAPAPTASPLSNSHRSNASPATDSADDSHSLQIGKNVRNPSTYQIVTFALAILLTIVYVPVAIFGHSQARATTSNCSCH